MTMNGVITPLIVGKFKTLDELLDIETFSVLTGSSREPDIQKPTTVQDFARNYYNKTTCTLKINGSNQDSKSFQYLKDCLTSPETPLIRIVTVTDDCTSLKCFDTWVESITFQKNGIFKDAIINCGTPSFITRDIEPYFPINPSGDFQDYILNLDITQVGESDSEFILESLEEFAPHLAYTVSSTTVTVCGILSLTSEYDINRFINEVHLLTKGRSDFRVQLQGLDNGYTYDTTFKKGRLELKNSLRDLVFEKMKDYL